jgi:malate dehydrogenase
MEVEDCCYPLVRSLVATTDGKDGFTGANVAVLLGGFPRQQGMERKDLTAKNARGMLPQAFALEQYADKDVKVLVVANPANTNALVAMEQAPNIPRANFSSLTRLDQERCRYFVSEYINEARKHGSLYADHPATRPADVHGVCIWGNHSSTQVPYLDTATVQIGNEKLPVVAILAKHPLNAEGANAGAAEKALMLRVQKRGAEIIDAQGASSGMSAANAIAKHLQDWLSTEPSADDDIISMGVVSDGNTYGVPNGLNFSFPCRRDASGILGIVPGLPISDAVQAQLDSTAAELTEERGDAFSALVGGAESKL